jgi:uncharacterized membrane protein
VLSGGDQAFGINDDGFVVGTSPGKGGGFDSPLEWSPEGAVITLQDIGGEGDSIPYAINDTGYIAGYSKTAAGGDAVVWGPDGQTIVLQDVAGSSSDSADGINNNGEVVGYSAILAPSPPPVPESSTCVMISVGLALGYASLSRRGKAENSRNFVLPRVPFEVRGLYF